MQRIADRQKLWRCQDLFMSFNCTMEHTVTKDNHITDALLGMHKYPGVSTTADNFIPHIVVSTTISPLQEITSNHINLSDHSGTCSPPSNHQYNNIAPSRAINFTHVDCNFKKCKGRAETVVHHHSCTYLVEENMELTSEDD